jgi:hypothetical protein
MSSDKKQKKQKRLNRKRREQARGKLPASVEALLQYLGGGGPAPAPQGDLKVKERAGVDNIDTLSQIIKQQQIQSASYMQNLQQIAFKSEIQQQLNTQDAKLKKQSQESKKAIEETQAIIKTETEEVKQAVRQYTFKTMDEKIDKVKRQIMHESSMKKRQPSEEKLELLNQELSRLEALKVQQHQLGISMYQPPSGTAKQTTVSIPQAPVQMILSGVEVSEPQATSAQPSQAFSFETAPTTSTLSALDINALSTSQFIGDIQNLPKVAQGGAVADIQENLKSFVSNTQGGVASGTGIEESVERQKKQGRTKKKP